MIAPLSYALQVPTPYPPTTVTGTLSPRLTNIALTINTFLIKYPIISASILLAGVAILIVKLYRTTNHLNQAEARLQDMHTQAAQALASFKASEGYLIERGAHAEVRAESAETRLQELQAQNGSLQAAQEYLIEYGTDATIRAERAGAKARTDLDKLKKEHRALEQKYDKLKTLSAKQNSLYTIHEKKPPLPPNKPSEKKIGTPHARARTRDTFPYASPS